MNLINKIEKYCSVIWCYLFAFFLIVTTGGAWFCDVSLTFPEDFVWKMLSLILIGGSAFFLLCGSKPVITKDMISKIAIVVGCAVTYRIASSTDTDYYEYRFLLMLLWMIGCLIIQNSNKYIWKAYVNVIVVLSVISLFFYLFGSILHLIPETGITGINWGATWDTSSVRTFFNLYYEAQRMKITDSYRIIRNCGVFAEAPMYNFVLCTALGVELFLQERTSKWKCMIITITIFTTLSTTGILFLVVAGALYIVEYAYRENILAAHKKLFGSILFIGVVMVLLILWTKTFSPSGAGSMNVRTDHLWACVKALIENPFLGCGYLNSDVVLSYAEHKQGLSVGLPYFFACGGVVLGLVLVFPYITNLKNAFKKKEFKEICFETLFLMLYFFTAITDRPLLLFFITYITLYRYE